MVGSCHLLEDWLGETTVLFFLGVELAEDGLFRGFPEQLVVIVEIESLLVFGLFLRLHLLSQLLSRLVQGLVEFGIAVAGIMLEGQYLLIPQVNLAQRV